MIFVYLVVSLCVFSFDSSETSRLKKVKLLGNLKCFRLQHRNSLHVNSIKLISWYQTTILWWWCHYWSSKGQVSQRVNFDNIEIYNVIIFWLPIDKLKTMQQYFLVQYISTAWPSWYTFDIMTYKLKYVIKVSAITQCVVMCIPLFCTSTSSRGNNLFVFVIWLGRGRGVGGRWASFGGGV